MVLRVWALYNRSCLILCILLTFYIIEVVSNFISYVLVSVQFRRDPAGQYLLRIVYDISHNLSSVVGTSQALDYSFCVWGNLPPIWGEILDVVQIALGALMCPLVVVRFVKESIQMYTVTKRFYLNRYVNLLVRQGVIYFIACVHVFSFSFVPLG